MVICHITNFGLIDKIIDYITKSTDMTKIEKESWSGGS